MAHARNRSLGYAVMGFRLPTIGGAVATGLHGSSPRFDSVLASRVRSIELVDSAGNLRSFSKGTTPAAQWRALTANAGMVGMVTQLRLATDAQFNLRVWPYEAPYKAVVETLVRNYGARIHLGKNKRWLFDLERQVGSYGSGSMDCVGLA
jgi:FAD/FMN-containing dehydrogenase